MFFVRKCSVSSNIFSARKPSDSSESSNTRGRHDVGHFGNATGRGVIDAVQLAVIAWMIWL